MANVLPISLSPLGGAIEFPAGLIGCPDWRRFHLEPDLESPVLGILRSEEQPGLSLLVGDPRAWLPDYTVEVAEPDLQALGAADGRELQPLAILTMETEPFAAYANLLGPLVVHPGTRLARQIIQSGRGLSARQPLGAPPPTLTFDDGLIGCPEWQHFSLRPLEQPGPVLLMVSLDIPGLSFPVTDPRLIVPGYSPKPAEEDLAALGVEDESGLSWFCILAVGSEPPRQAANLLGPLAVNRQTGQARQLVLSGSGYSAAFELDGGGPAQK